MSHILVVDVGNSRMKWALVAVRGVVAQGAIPVAEIGTLALRDWQNLPRPASAYGVNVAGEAARVRVEGQLTRWRIGIHWLVPRARACGVVNRYAQPAQLGADRWASVVAARQRMLKAGGPPAPLVVVNAGTAVTVDTLSAEGVFLGGFILPNMRLMLRALAENTAALKIPAGGFDPFPTSTPDALYTGALSAVCGAIEMARHRAAPEAPSVRCFVAGGAAHELVPHLALPVEVVDNLVLEGVLAIAAERG